ncbi:hypothetical protein DOTSEDRAFT_29496 [Dothistroma septosporum NZE10]|uniref:Trichothecene 3-O-acetyltransferase-like N-terminal domain-containing protein n=1 Tax=Dothistroma septosporum (strain NZE10 / CBS 128990) TaxID=675120 RepID=N1PCB9_DOTSN|nr:hypothetical protein DOTSEDRAFT_29496 [Dothistroma septosporum NZE10]
MDSDDCLNVFEQRPRLVNLCISLTFIFTTPDNSDDEAILDVLRKGLDRLSDNFPWIAGKITKSDGDTALWRIVRMDGCPQLIVKDLRHDTSIRTMEEMRSIHFAPDAVPQNIFAPRKTVLVRIPVPLPVLVVQASFIRGGLVVCLSASHAATDFMGLYQIVLAFHWACKGETLRQEDISISNMPRRNMIPLLEASEDISKEVDHQRQPRGPSTTKVKSHFLSQCSWGTFKISKVAVKILKSEAIASLQSGYVSSDDIVSGFVWQAVTRARLHRLDPKTPTILARHINARRYLGIAESYPGLCINTAFSKFPMGKLVSMPLWSIAQALRSRIDPVTSNFAHYTRSVASVLSNSPDKDVLRTFAKFDHSSDLSLTSGASVSESLPLDFNLGLGNPASLRVPLPSPLGLQSVVGLAPKTAQGDWIVYMCLRNDDLWRLRKDSTFTNHASWLSENWTSTLLRSLQSTVAAQND